MIVSALIALIGLIAFASAACPPPENIVGCKCRRSASKVIVTCSVPSLLKTAVKGFSEPQPTTIDEMTIKGLPKAELPNKTLEAAFLDKAIVKKLIIKDKALTSATIHVDAFRLQERSLQELTFECEKLEKVPYPALKYLFMLKKLVITKSTELKKLIIPPVELPIEALHIYGNKLATIPANCFDKFPKLKVLKLSENAIVEIPAVVLKEKNQVNHVELQNNKMTKIPLEFLKVLPKGAAVILDYNIGIVNATAEDIATIMTGKLRVSLENLMIDCGCQFKTVASLNEVGRDSGIYGRCASPSLLSGTDFNKLVLDNFKDCPDAYYFHDSQLIGDEISFFV